MRTLPRVHFRTPAWASLVAIVLVAGCTASPPPPSMPAAPSPSSSATSPSGQAEAAASTFGVDPAVVAEVRELCAPGPGKTVEELPDSEIPAVTWPGVSVPEKRVGTKTAKAIDIAPLDVPATPTEAGCLVTYDAPAGCLPAVAISAAWIPGYRIEGYSYPDAQGETVTVEPLANEASVVAGSRAEQRCQVETSSQYVSAVYRLAIYRRAIYQRAVYRSAHYRQALSSDGESADPVTILPLSVPAVSLQAAAMESASLPARQVTKDVSAVEDDTRVAYEASEAVLFEYHRSVLLPDAAQTLDAILADAGAKGFTGSIRVEGHTDDTGEESANQRLSEARAQAVTDYLVGHGIAAGRVTVTGRGETAPAHPNDTDENRAKNRRVVIEFRP